VGFLFFFVAIGSGLRVNPKSAVVAVHCAMGKKTTPGTSASRSKRWAYGGLGSCILCLFVFTLVCNLYLTRPTQVEQTYEEDYGASTPLVAPRILIEEYSLDRLPPGHAFRGAILPPPSNSAVIDDATGTSDPTPPNFLKFGADSNGALDSGEIKLLKATAIEPVDAVEVSLEASDPISGKQEVSAVQARLQAAMRQKEIETAKSSAEKIAPGATHDAIVPTFGEIVAPSADSSKRTNWMMLSMHASLNRTGYHQRCKVDIASPDHAQWLTSRTTSAPAAKHWLSIVIPTMPRSGRGLVANFWRIFSEAYISRRGPIARRVHVHILNMQTSEQRKWYQSQRAYAKDDMEMVGELVQQKELGNFRLLETVPSSCDRSRGGEPLKEEEEVEAKVEGEAGATTTGAQAGTKAGTKAGAKAGTKAGARADREQVVQNMVSALLSAYSSCTVMLLVQDYMTVCPRIIPVLYHAVQKANEFDSERVNLGARQNQTWLALRMSNEVSGTVIQCKDAPALAAGVLDIALRENIGLEEAVDEWFKATSAGSGREVLQFTDWMVRPVDSDGGSRDQCSQPVKNARGKDAQKEAVCKADDIDPCPNPPMKWDHDDTYVM
jgi:hypothetical protein